MSERKENRLKNAASAYLRSAAHQPIDWQEWGPEAFARAKEEDKPILLDIGAVWCHWCHVIDRESYENPDIAEIINRLYVAVKVDRDERPDVDARYQAAVGAISGQGGWPLTGFLTPEGKPFFGGTYFPPEDGMGRPGFKRILLTMAEAYRTRRKDVEESAGALAEAVARAEMLEGARGKFDPAVVEKLVDSMVRMFDLRNGGFGQAPKFPHPTALELILERYQATGEKHLLTVVEATLEKMAKGGVYDQLAGGFHRYSVDERWRVPHFEKMSYDNSELLRNYLHGYQVSRHRGFREIAEGIIGWVNEVLSDQERGGFYASQDADVSLEDDGDYFTWSVAEVRGALDADEARVVEEYYNVGELGEMHHNRTKNVLWVASEAEAIARKLGRSETDVRLLLARARGKLLAARTKRPTPYVDSTLYTGWNAMFVSAYLDAGNVLGRRDCRDFALKTLERILAGAWNETKGFAHRVGSEWMIGSLEDHVCMVLALLDAYEATLVRRYFDCAELALDLVLERFGDAEGGGFFDRSEDAPPMGGLEVRRKPFQDSPTPGANSLAIVALERMHGYANNAKYREASERALEAFAGIAPQMGLFAASYGLAAILHARHPMQVVIVGRAGDPKASELEQAATGVYRFGKSVLRVTPEIISGDGLAPALRETLPHLRADVVQALVCVNSTCQPPIHDARELARALSEAG